MKTNLSILTGAASLAALMSGAVAQTSAVTDPVGYITENITGGPATGAFTLIAPSLVTKTEFAGASSNAPSASLISTTATLPAGLNDGYFVELKGGAQEGWWSTIQSVTGGDITVQGTFPAGLAVGQQFMIRKHQTLGSFLGANSAGIDPGLSLDDADEVQLLDGATQVVAAYFYALAADGAPADGWYDASGNASDNEIIPPGNSVLVKRKQAGDKSFIQVGHVKTTKTQIGIWQGDNWVTPMLATGGTLGSLNLDTGDLATGVQRGVDLNVDEFQLINTNQSVSAFFAADPIQAGVTGWYDSGGNPADATLVAENTGAIVRRKVNQTAIWTAPAQVIAP
ncbi:MAG: hypothetical protein KA004_14540 [Verrucomicrobiales bacterium]|nr:hypothetical protein [Verrucomicrobiales bacterium]